MNSKTNPHICKILFLVCLLFLAACGGRRRNIPSPSAPSVPSPTAAQKSQATLETLIAATQTDIPATPVPSDTSIPPTLAPSHSPALLTQTLAPPTLAPIPASSLSEANPQGIEQKLGLHTDQASGQKKYVVIRADFPDVERKTAEDKLSDRLLRFLSGYLRQASYQNLSFEGSLTKRYLLPHPVAYYKISPRNLEVDENKVLALVNDVLAAADNDIQFSEDLFVLISLGATHNEYGMVGYSAIPGMLDFKSASPITTASGESVSNVVVFCENAHLGTYVHDTLHMLGGVIDDQRMTPCLYDHDLQAKYSSSEDWVKVLVNMGYWDPLSSHFPYNRELPPSGLSSWTKLRLGWIDPEKIALVYPGETATIQLDPLADSNASTLVIKIPVSETAFYLVENRQPVNSDANLPASGVLILYADDSVFECRHGKAPVKIMDANPQVSSFNDATYDIGKNAQFIDEKNNLAIVLERMEGLSYIITVTTPDQAP